jgi:hypothetical protein
MSRTKSAYREKPDEIPASEKIRADGEPAADAVVVHTEPDEADARQSRG